MASDSWSSSLSTSSRRYHSRSEMYEETDLDEDLKAEFLCPFCAEDFDVVGLCCHIDEEHPVEAKNGVCPVCAKRVGVDIVGHITLQHGNFFKVQRRRRLRKGVNSAFSLLRKELREGSLQSLLGGSSCFLSSSNTEPDPLLSSFISNSPSLDESLNIQPLSSVEAGLQMKGSTTEEFQEREAQQSLVSDRDQQEKSQRCKFVQGLLLSTILDDEL
ncbi:protein DEHYDRATION-INDUCED 19 homolog 4 [Manihot esculenta]|uniref:Drought induced 19 protein type zinc-binding domain-containing protein n=1 Tax=Manihot esculenta TaxID=3983 RepID=A0A2C9UCU0_MANES|nr:protein DEHYDRATION-INDUCED 19 homolog 4 [Manihot esculenta]OAY27688.1 hypothetical protein MANES_15G007500v8 [Manihot esculenta]